MNETLSYIPNSVLGYKFIKCKSIRSLYINTTLNNLEIMRLTFKHYQTSPNKNIKYSQFRYLPKFSFATESVLFLSSSSIRWIAVLKYGISVRRTLVYQYQVSVMQWNGKYG